MAARSRDAHGAIDAEDLGLVDGHGLGEVVDEGAVRLDQQRDQHLLALDRQGCLRPAVEPVPGHRAVEGAGAQRGRSRRSRSAARAAMRGACTGSSVVQPATCRRAPASARTKCSCWPRVATGSARTRASAVSRAVIQRSMRAGWRTRNGAMPRPVALPMPSRRRSGGARVTAVCAAAQRGHALDEVGGEGADQVDGQHLRAEGAGKLRAARDDRAIGDAELAVAVDRRRAHQIAGRLDLARLGLPALAQGRHHAVEQAHAAVGAGEDQVARQIAAGLLARHVLGAAARSRHRRARRRRGRRSRPRPRR